MIYFTDEDPGITKEHRRDPLGLQSLWSYYAAKVIKNLTTVSNDFRGFREVLLCLDLCWLYLEENESDKRDSIRLNKYILCFEQLFIYSMVDLAETGDSKDLEGIIGSDAGQRKYHESGGNPRIRHSETILVNQLGLGYYGRYKTPMRNMGLIDRQSRLCIPHEQVQNLYGKSFEQLKKAVFGFFKLYEKNHNELLFGSFKDRKMLKETVCGSLRPDEYKFWMDRFQFVTDNLMQTFYKHVTADTFKNEKYKQIFKCVLHEYKPYPQEVENIIQFEAYVRCVEKVFFTMLNSKDLADVSKKIGSLDIYRERYSRFINLPLPAKSAALCERIKKLKACNPSEEDYLIKIYEYHKFVSNQKNRSPWLEILKGNIQSFNHGDDSFDLITWGRDYYLGSMDGIGSRLEALHD